MTAVRSSRDVSSTSRRPLPRRLEFPDEVSRRSSWTWWNSERRRRDSRSDKDFSELKQVADLVAGQPVQYLLQRQAGLEAFDLTQNVRDQCVWLGSRSVVWGNRHLRMRPQGARRRQRLGRKNVERGAGE